MYLFISTVIEELQNRNSKSIYILETCAKCGTELLSDLKDLMKIYNDMIEEEQKNSKNYQFT